METMMSTREYENQCYQSVCTVKDNLQKANKQKLQVFDKIAPENLIKTKDEGFKDKT